MQIPSVLSNVASGAWGVIKTRPLSTLFATGSVVYTISGAASKDEVSDSRVTDIKEVALLGACLLATWLGLRKLDDYFLANPVSTAILGYEAFRIGHNTTDEFKSKTKHLASESKFVERLCKRGEEWEYATPLSERLMHHWNRFGLQDLGIVLTAALVHFKGPELFTHRFLTWVR